MVEAKPTRRTTWRRSSRSATSIFKVKSTNWTLIQRYYCVPKERDALKVGGLVVALYIIGPPLMFFPAIAATRFIPTLADAGDIYPTLCAQLFPAGMLGLAIAAMFAATMSTLSGDYNVCASVLTNDVYRRLIRPQASQRELVNVGRIMTLVIGIIALGAAMLIARGKAENLFRIMVTLFGVATAPVAVPMLLGLLSRRHTNASAIGGFLLGIGTGLGLFFFSQYGPAGEFLGVSWDPAKEEVAFGGFALKMEIVLFLSTAIVTFVTMEIVSLIQRLRFPVSAARQQQIDAFLEQLGTPIGQLEEDQVGGQESTLSPFWIVGICVLVIGLMMLAVVPWAAGSVALWIDAFLSLLLIATGVALMRVNPGRVKDAESISQRP